MFVQARSHGHSDAVPSPKFFGVPQNFVVPRKICFEHKIKTEILLYGPAFV